MTNLLGKFVLFLMLKNPFQLFLNISTGLIFSSVLLTSLPAIANAEIEQVTLSIDATFTPTFTALMNQAESLAGIEVYRRFQADPTLRELQITVLGERNGQIVSLLSSRISRDEWRTSSDIRQWAQYYSASSALLGYRNSNLVAAQASEGSSSISSFEPSPSETLEEARLSKRISEDEYWQLVDAID